MKPDVNQHLQSMNKALVEVILPELESKPFAKEQASLISASLQLLVEVQEHEFHYIKQEYEDTRTPLKTGQKACRQTAEFNSGRALTGSPTRILKGATFCLSKKRPQNSSQD
ncbi:MAG: hypothetical protein R3E73_05885 [Porticoccaceae bacterium]